MYDRVSSALAAATSALLLAVVISPASAVAANAWTPFAEGSGAVCADGSKAHFLERVADPSHVVLYFEGGGACFSKATCDFDGPEKSYISESFVTTEMLADRGGMFDFAQPDNPLADYSFVYVPYCTGDVHLGNKETTYGDGLTVQHRGYPNGLLALDHLAATYPDAETVVVAGSSAGSVPTPLFAGLAADRLPDARLVTIGDSSGAYPDDPMLNTVIGSLWGTMNALPDWPETADVNISEWSIPGLYGYAAEHDPDITFGKFDFAEDATQASYAQLVGMGSDALLARIDEIDADIRSDVEAAGATVSSYVAPGTEHTILGTDAFYTTEVNGTPFAAWLGQLVEGAEPASIHCEDCR